MVKAFLCHVTFTRYFIIQKLTEAQFEASQGLDFVIHKVVCTCDGFGAINRLRECITLTTRLRIGFQVIEHF